MEKLTRVIKTSLTPLIALSCLGMAAAGGVLVWSGHWRALWTCALVFFISPFIFPLLMIPAAFCGGLMRVFLTAQPLVARAMQALASGWLIFILAFWGAMVFDMAMPLTQDPALQWPALAWCVAGSVAPWAVFARGDRDNIFFTEIVLLFFLGCLAAAAALLQGPLRFWQAFWIAAIAMAAPMAAQAVIEETLLKKKP